MVTILDTVGGDTARPRHPEKAHRPDTPVLRKPAWIRVKAPGSPVYNETRQIVRENNLVTVCEEAGCPNIGECWSKKHATMMIMGDTCTRACAFCNVATGRPDHLDPLEPLNVGRAVRELGLEHVVITSVDRDDLPDGGARIFGWLIDDIHERLPECSIEVLTPDFRGMEHAIERVISARPDIFNHNMETVERLHPDARPGAKYERSLGVLSHAKSLDDSVLIKTGIMLGLGEEADDVRGFMDDALEAGVQILTLGQYLRPSQRHRAIDRYVPPEEFAEWKDYGERLGFLHVESGPLVRSSYHAREQVEELRARAGAMATAV